MKDLDSLSEYIKLGRSVFLQTDNGAVARVVKLEPPCPDIWWRYLVRKLTHGSLPFENEIIINKQLMRSAFKFLRFPKILESDLEDALVFEFMDFDETRNLDNEQVVKMLNAICEFNTSDIVVKRNLVNSLLFYISKSPLFTTIGMIVKSEMAFRAKLNLVGLTFRCVLSNKNRQTVLLHNDLVLSNIFRLAGSSEVVMIDFEDSIRDSNFIFSDCVDVLFNASELKLNLPELQRFGARLSESEILITGEIQFQNIARICLIKHCLRKSISLKISSIDRKRLVRFVETVLANDCSFLSWLYSDKNKVQ